ncbi:MAG: hypothetical protein ABI970_24640, partial [Chloroflexota bacterium]
PMVFETDAQAIDAAITAVFRAHPEGRSSARVMRIHSTLDLEAIWVSAPLLDDVQASEGFIEARALQPMNFDNGALVESNTLKE